MTDAPKPPTGDRRAVVVIPFLLRCFKKQTMRFIYVLILQKYDCCLKNALMAVCNWVFCNGPCRCVAIVGAIILAPRHMVLSLRLDWWSGTHLCVQRVPGHQSGCEDYAMGVQDGDTADDWGRHAPLDWNSYNVHGLAHWLKSYPSIEVAINYHVGVEIRDN